MDKTSGDSLRERTKNHMRAEIADIAIDLFLARGFDETTTDDVVAAAGVSRRTFFRYFPTKEDAVLGIVVRLATEGCHRFVSCPPEHTTWEALGASTTPFIEWVGSDQDRALALLKLINGNLALRASFLDRLDRFRHSLAAVIAQRLNEDSDGMRPALIAAVTLAALDVALLKWGADDGKSDLRVLLDEAFAAVRMQQNP